MNKGGKIIGSELKVTKALATLERQHNKYLSNLPIFDQYTVWTYTLGSQPVNRRLVGMPVSPKSSQEWTYHLFGNFTYGLNNISRSFKKWKDFFKNPNIYQKLPDEIKNNIANQALILYTRNLQRIIKKAPVTTDDIIVYKASTPYDKKLVENNFPFTLEQTPFNSTTYDPWFDFNSFLASNLDKCCLWEIMIPKGSHVLAIAHQFQAYLTEREILLPYDSIFNVIGAEQVEMSYYDTKDEVIRTQNEPFNIGEVYRHDNWKYKPQSIKTMRLLKAIFHNH